MSKNYTRNYSMSKTLAFGNNPSVHQDGKNSLFLRVNHDRLKQSLDLSHKNQERHTIYLKEMLVNKFLNKHHMVDLGAIGAEAQRKEQKVKIFVAGEFENFIQQGHFTQKNLAQFEAGLKGRMEVMFAENGIKFDPSPQRRSKRQSVSPDNMERLKMGVKSPMAQQYLAQQQLNRGKTAAVGRNMTQRPSYNGRSSLPNIGTLRPSVQMMSPQNGARVNNLFSNVEPKASISMNNYADIRLKLGQKKIPDRFQKVVKTKAIEGVADVESIPSDIGTDQWNEINQHDYELYQKQKRDKKNDDIAKKVMIKKTLDVQVKEREMQKQRIIEQNWKIDQTMLKKAKRELAAEKKRDYEQTRLVALQKAQRDVMLLEAQKQKIEAFQSMRTGELQEVQKLKVEIEKEKKDKLKVKMTEREAAQKVIRENVVVRERKNQEKELEKIHQQKLQQDYLDALDAQDRKRKEDREAREQRIQNIMNKMGDVLKKSDAEEKAFDVRILNQTIEKDKQASHREKQQARHALELNIQIKRELDVQMQEKNQKKLNDKKENQKFVKMIISQDEEDQRKMRAEADLHAIKRKETADAQRQQMFSQNRLLALVPLTNTKNDLNQTINGFGEKKLTSVGPNTSLEAFRYQAAKKNKKTSVMSVEELRMNKQLLREISLKKKQTPLKTQASPRN